MVHGQTGRQPMRRAGIALAGHGALGHRPTVPQTGRPATRRNESSLFSVSRGWQKEAASPPLISWCRAGYEAVPPVSGMLRIALRNGPAAAPLTPEPIAALAGLTARARPKARPGTHAADLHGTAPIRRTRETRGHLTLERQSGRLFAPAHYQHLALVGDSHPGALERLPAPGNGLVVKEQVEDAPALTGERRKTANADASFAGDLSQPGKLSRPALKNHSQSVGIASLILPRGRRRQTDHHRNRSARRLTALPWMS
jgi:hypothetical protein